MTDLPETVLIERVRALIPDDAVAQKRMFGGTCFMVNGNMLVCTSKGGLMARVGKDRAAQALARPHASECRPTGRPMPGFIRVEAEGIETDEQLRDWIEMARAYVCALPPNAGKTKRATARKARS